jgi:glyceraldehyde 3-phosphate dehydrogenase
MSLNIGINGCGRIGKLVFRAAFENFKNINVVAINDPFLKTDYMVYQLKYDSVHGKFKGTIEKVDEHTIKVNGQTIKVFNEMKPADIKWGSVGAKVVAESSGAFLT